MMMPEKRPAKQPGRSRRLSRAVPFWQRALLGFYIALFALILPLICWGALAEPGHPHRYPHFVFATPVLAMAQTGGGPANRQQPALAAHRRNTPHGQHGAMQPPADNQARMATVCNLIADGIIPGRATPMLMAFSLLLLVFLRIWTVRRLDRSHFVLWQRPPFPESLFLPVPLRPPRLRFAPFV